MKLREEYLDIDIKEICIENENKMTNNNISEEWLKDFDEKLKKIYDQNSIEIYISLYLIAKKCYEEKININIAGKWNDIFDCLPVTYTLLVEPFENIVNTKIADIEIKDKAIIIESNNSERLKEMLNLYCIDWKDTFILNSIE